MIKVLYVIPSFGKGGAERLLVDICLELNQRAHKVQYIVFSLFEENKYIDLTKSINLETINFTGNIPLFKRKNDKNIICLFDKIKSFNPDIIHSHLFYADVVSRVFILPNIKYISHIHGPVSPYETSSPFWSRKKAISFIEKIMIKKIYKQCNNLFIAVSKAFSDYLIENNIAKSNDIKILPNAINYEKFLSSRKRRIDINGCIRLVTVGRIEVEKNHLFLVDVISILKKRGYNVILDIIGHGSLYNNIQKRIEYCGLIKWINLIGIVDCPEKNYANADIYLHSATYEPFGLVFLEAMASGLPVVCLDGKGNRDIIEQGKNGFMIYEQNAEMFAEKIIELIENPELYHRMSSYCVEFARKYDIKDYVDKLINLYEEVLGK